MHQLPLRHNSSHHYLRLHLEYIPKSEKTLHRAEKHDRPEHDTHY